MLTPYYENEHGKLYCGDCLEIMPALISEGVKVDIAATDPPFNFGYHYDTYCDRVNEDSYIEWIAEVIHYPFVLIHYPEMLYKILFFMGYFPDRVVSWIYNSNTPRQHRDIAFVGIEPDFSKVKQPYKNPTDRRVARLIAAGRIGADAYDWWNVDQVKNVSAEKTEHPCQMPLEIMKRIIGVLPDGKTIFDPFAGSGTTLVAAQSLGRRWIGIEISEQYCEIAKKRLEKTIRQIEGQATIFDELKVNP